MFSTTYDSEGWDRKSRVGFAGKIRNVFVKWNLVFPHQNIQRSAQNYDLSSTLILLKI
jgi:hypothetical protein